MVIAQTKWSTDQRKPHAELIQQLIADGWQPSGTDRLGTTDEVGENESHPLASLMEVLGVLIEKYEDEHVPEITEQ